MGNKNKTVISPITKRFIKAIEHILLMRRARSEREIAHAIGSTSQAFTNIKKSRANIGPEFLAKLVIEYDISGEWLLANKGSIELEKNNSEGKLINEIRYLKKENALLKRLSPKKGK